MPLILRRFLLAVFLVSSLPVAARADALSDRLDEQLDLLWGQGLGERPATPILLLWEMAVDEERAATILERADERSRALTDTLLSTISLSEPLARRQLPALHVVRDQDPAGIDQPPTWKDLRRVGLELLERIALDADSARDGRHRRELIAARARIQRWTPSEVGGLVILWQRWWVERGDAAGFYLTPGQRPDVTDWWQRYANPHASVSDVSLWQLIGSLHDDALRARLFVEGLKSEEHEFLVAECMEILESYPADFERRGLPGQQWNPQTGRNDGYRASVMREMSLEILMRVSPFFPSGISEHERIRDCFLWWKRARFEARYYRDPNDAPSLAEYLRGWDRPESEGGNSIARLLRRLFLEQESRALVLDRFSQEQASMVGELVPWLDYDFAQASSAGFNFNYNLEPIRPVPSQTGPRAVITLEAVRAITRLLLERVGDYRLPFSELGAEEQDGLWRRWWEGVRRDPKWYRGELPTFDDAPTLFQIERGRADGR